MKLEWDKISVMMMTNKIKKVIEILKIKWYNLSKKLNKNCYKNLCQIHPWYNKKLTHIRA